MKLKEYLDNLNSLVKQDPKVLDLDVIYAEDDEGNSFNLVSFYPTLFIFDHESYEVTESNIDDANAICIN